jgi:hypothetical protein
MNPTIKISERYEHKPIVDKISPMDNKEKVEKVEKRESVEFRSMIVPEKKL